MLGLPEALFEALTRRIRELWGPSTSLVRAEPVSGGDIHEAARIVLSDGRTLFVKYNPEPLPGLFEVEERGLALLRSTQTVRVPEVYAAAEATEKHPAFLLMEWIEPGGSSPDTLRAFGRGLAHLHRHSGEFYGLDHDNYIGSLPQPNTPTRSWVEFYRERRLGVQMELAGERGRLPAKRRERLERLRERLEEFIDESHVKPSLLHGDLWGGNYLISSEGEAVLIDPAVYYGDREVELAFTELFGGFPPEFYEGYREVWPLDPGYEERKPLYQLYPLLVHLNLFGEGYGGRVDRVLRHYVG